jgi:hypothetical protein
MEDRTNQFLRAGGGNIKDWDAYEKEVEETNKQYNQNLEEQNTTGSAFEGKDLLEGGNDGGGDNSENLKLKKPKNLTEPKDYNARQNLEEGVNAVMGGVVDTADSLVGGVTRIFDPRFYSTDDGEYRPPWLPSDILNMEPPETKTVWGKMIRKVVEMGGLMALTRKGASSGSRALSTKAPGVAKPLNWYGKGSATKGNFGDRLKSNIAHGAVEGVVADALSLDSTGDNTARIFADQFPQLAPMLEPLATRENMSPAQRALYNIVEGMGLGVVIDTAASGIGAGFKAVGRGVTNMRTPKAATSLAEDNAARLAELAAQKNRIKADVGAQGGAKRAFKKDPANNKPWAKFTPEEKEAARVDYAKKRNISYGEAADHPAMARAKAQSANETEMGIKRFEADPTVRNFDGYVMSGGESSQGRALSSNASPTETAADLNRIARDPSQRKGTPRSFVTDAVIERVNDTVDGTDITATEWIRRRFETDQGWKEFEDTLRRQGTRADQYAPQAYMELAEVITDRKLLYTMDDEDFKRYFDSRFMQPTDMRNGMVMMGDSDFAKASIMAGLLNRELADISMGARSVSEFVDVTSKDGLLDMALRRWQFVDRLIKERTAGSSDSLRGLSRNQAKEKMADIATESATRADAIRMYARESPEFLQSVLDAFALNGSLKNAGDIDNAMRKLIWGYNSGDEVKKSLARQEADSMIIHSLISSPKTVGRAAFGTGLVAFTRPMQTAIGAGMVGDKRSSMAALAAYDNLLGTVWEGTQVFGKKLWAGLNNRDLTDLGTIATHDVRGAHDIDVEAALTWAMKNGTAGDKAMALTANTMHHANKFVLFTWSSKALGAVDTAFNTMMGRMALKQKAFLAAYDEVVDASGFIREDQLKQFRSLYEQRFESSIWNADGSLADEAAKYAYKEATMTKELGKLGKGLDDIMGRFWFTRPFMLFARTSFNALELTTKHTPIVNNFVKEVWDIKTLPTGHEDLIKYGIRSPDEHEAAKALVRGREAMGAMTITAAGSLWMQGRLTGNGPNDPKRRQFMERNLGWQRQSIRIGDRWVSYQSLEPFNSLLSFVADVGDNLDLIGMEKAEKSLGSAMYLIYANVTNKSFLAGLADLWEVLQPQSGFDRAGKTGANILNGYMPLSSLRNDIAKLMNPGMRELEAGFMDNLKNRNPGFRGELPYATDILNGSVVDLAVNPWERYWNTFSPFKMTLQTSQTRELLWRSMYNINQSFTTAPDGVGEIPASLRAEWADAVGKQNIEAQLAQLFRSRAIQESIANMERDREMGNVHAKVADYAHYREIDKIFTNAKKIAWKQLKAGSSEAAALVEQAQVKDAASQRRKKGQYGEAAELDGLLNSIR